jgi:hypothetical protein
MSYNSHSVYTCIYNYPRRLQVFRQSELSRLAIINLSSLVNFPFFLTFEAADSSPGSCPSAPVAVREQSSDVPPSFGSLTAMYDSMGAQVLWVCMRHTSAKEQCMRALVSVSHASTLMGTPPPLCLP